MHQIARHPWSIRKPIVVSAVLLLAFILSSALTTNKSSSCRKHEVKNAVIPVDRLPKFSNFKNNPLCLRLPDTSTTYVWSQLQVSSKKLRPSVIKRQMQNSPSHAHIERLANRIIETSDKPIGILILLSKSQVKSKWPQRLQSLVNDALGTTRVKVHATSVDDDDLMLERAKESAIVVDCRGSDEMKFLKTKFSDLSVLPDAVNFLHELKQKHIRFLLTKTPNPPLLILVADSPNNKNPLSSSVYSRTVQRLAHWYHLGFVMMKEQDKSDSFEQTIAFAVLVWLEDYCSSTILDNSKALLPGVQKLVEQVMPPSLELSTTWHGISAEWHRTEQAWQNRK